MLIQPLPGTKPFGCLGAQWYSEASGAHSGTSMVEFAPWSVPWERRLQTLSVLQWVFSFLALDLLPASLPSSDLHYSLHRPPVHQILVPQCPVCNLVVPGPRQAMAGRQARPVPRRSVVWKYMKDYFPVSLVKTAELDPSRNYLAGIHPHGVLAAGIFVNLCTEGTGFSELFPGIRPHLMMLKPVVPGPLLQGLPHDWGAMSVARGLGMRGKAQSQCSGTPSWRLVTSDKECAAHVLNRKGGGNLLGIIVGGAQEALNARPGAYKLLLRNRKGFVKLALMHGVPLVPVFSFGENELFDQVENSPGSWLRWIQNQLQKVMGISLPLFHGRGIFQYSFGLLPYRRPIATVVGKPIEVQQIPQPSQEEVDKLHQHYIDELCNLFEAHKLKYNVPEDQHLEFC
ncbi:hypothetical protein QTO34_003929 [Cnephaeus nilssonii]|uniref:Acyltransferase n=1 Tax=Cnephaeus nilssonii TaxID=3371016 RepID=A0AA40HRK8_CNENI|nr:hypothetical protein QTO34_003929 [Eptesicus nilssonii]